MSYQKLVKDIQKRLEKVEQYTANDDERLQTLNAYWIIGESVYGYTRKSGEVIKNIALDAGASRGTLEKCVRFFRQYPDGFKDEIEGHPLNWSHYAALLYVADRKERSFYIQSAALNQWSSHELRLRIRNNYYENRCEAGATNKNDGPRLRDLNQKLYTYAAQVARVVDADTLVLDIDVGFKAKMEHKVRLRGINCPEKGTKKGGQAKVFVEDCLSEGGVVIRSYKAGKFGRYIVDLWYLKGETDKETILSHGRLLNQELLDKGLARIVE